MEKKNYTQLISELFTEVLETYDEEEPKYFNYFGRKLANFSPLSHDMNVLDLACGKGAVFYPIYEELSHYGCLLGIDKSDGMVDKLNNEILAYKLQNAVVLKMDAEKLDFPDEFFDLITCGLSLFFMNNDKVFSEIKRVLKESGYFTFSTWMNDDSNQFQWYENIIKKYLPIIPANKSYLSQESTDDLHTVDGIETLLKKHHMRLIKIATEIKTFNYPNAQSYWSKLWSHGARKTIEKIPHDQLNSFKADIFNRFNSIKGENGLDVNLGVIYVCCSKYDIDFI